MLSTEKAMNYILTLLIVFLVITILFFTRVISGYILPVILAFFSAFSLSPLLKKMHQTKVPNWASTIIVIMFFITFISFILIMLIFSLQRFIGDLPSIIKQLQKNLIILATKISENPIVAQYISRERLIDMVIDNVGELNIRGYFLTSVNFIFDLLKGFFVYTISLIFITPGMTRLEERVSKAFPDNKLTIYTVLKQVNKQIQSYVMIKTIISMITGLATFIICVSFGIKYSILWGFIAFSFNYIPYLGSTLAVLFPSLFSLIQHQSIVITISLAILLMLTQVLLGNIIENKVQSKGVNLSPIVILISLMFWGYLWGIIGIIIAVPLMSTFNLICENIDQLRPISYLISSSEK